MGWYNLDRLREGGGHIKQAVAIVRIKSSALGTIMVSNSQRPGFCGRIHVHPTTFGPFRGEEHLLSGWQAEDEARCQAVNVMTRYHEL